MKPLRMFTGRYSNPAVGGSGLAPVGITRYPPRFRLGYELKANLYDLAPTAAMLAAHRSGATMEAFVAEYEHRLQQLGIEAIVRQLAAMQSDAEGVVLLCFEDVTAGEVCHRRMLATWLERVGGVVVPELPDPGRKRPGRKTPSNPSSAKVARPAPPVREEGTMKKKSTRRTAPPEKPQTSIAGELVEFRQEFNLSKQEVVDLLLKYEVRGTNWATLHRWEESRQRPRAITERAIREALRLAKNEPSTIEAIRRR